MEKKTEAFAKAYEALNARQREAVDAIYGPVFVSAGPGTGKTQMLALRIGNILLKSPGVTPGEILALTFTESAVAALRERLVSLIGGAAYRVSLYTFHGFARAILEKRSDLFPRIASGMPLSDVRAMTLIESLLDSAPYPKLRNPKWPYRAAKPLYAFFGTLKKERYTPEAYQAEIEASYEAVCADASRFHTKGAYAGKEKGEYVRKRERLEKYREVAKLFRAYEEALERESLYDYEDLISEAVRGLESYADFHAEVAEQFQFVLADEHQDANPAQNKLLRLISDTDGAPNLFIVGDEKQSIYRFQGASADTFFALMQAYPSAKVLSLDENYRSKGKLLEAAHALSAPLPVPSDAFRPLLKSVRGAGGELFEAAEETPHAEQEAILSRITALHEARVPYDAIAVIARTNAEVLALSELLAAAGIPENHTAIELDALAHPAGALFLDLVRGLVDPFADGLLVRAFLMPGIPEPLERRMDRITHRSLRMPFLSALEDGGSPEIAAWAWTMRLNAEAAPVTGAMAWLTRLAHESGFLKGILSIPESEEAYEAYQGLMQEAALVAREKPGATVRDVLAHLDRMKAHELAVKRPQTDRSGVRLLTAHSAKGLEFPHVIIAHATDERWVRGKADEFSLLEGTPETDESDERRLLYVALTRARDSVLITHSAVDAENRVRTPLRFLTDFGSMLQPFPVQRSRSPLVPPVPKRVLDPDFLLSRLREKGFSPTSFNHFHTSPWQYYFRSLLALPDVETRSAVLGTAVHAGLESFARSVKTGHPDEPLALSVLQKSLSTAALLPSDREALSQKGEAMLRAYLAHERGAFANVYETEYALTGALSVPDVGVIPLSGKIDRIDRLPDGSFRIIDYKTGAPHSENKILGKTKDADGGYYRQLVFYRLLLEKEGRSDIGDFSIHFVEPDTNGKPSIRSFPISHAQAEALEAELIAAAKSIADGSAFSVPCDPATCDYCDLAEIIMRSR